MAPRHVVHQVREVVLELIDTIDVTAPDRGVTVSAKIRRVHLGDAGTRQADGQGSELRLGHRLEHIETQTHSCLSIGGARRRQRAQPLRRTRARSLFFRS